MFVEVLLLTLKMTSRDKVCYLERRKPTVHLKEPTVRHEVLFAHHKVTSDNIGELGDLGIEDFT